MAVGLAFLRAAAIDDAIERGKGLTKTGVDCRTIGIAAGGEFLGWLASGVTAAVGARMASANLGLPDFQRARMNAI